MADALSDGAAVRPTGSKRRRLLDPSAVVPVPVYSNQVSSGLQMKLAAPLFTERKGTDDPVLSPFSHRAVITLTSSDSEDDGEPKIHKHTNKQAEPPRCPSPPPAHSDGDHRQSRKVQRKLSEINRTLKSLVSPESQQTQSRRRRRASRTLPRRGYCDEDDVIMVDPPYSSTLREIPLKVRCRTDVHKISVQLSTPLSTVLTQLSIILEVPPSRLLLLRDDVELPSNSSIGELGISIADIIECVVLAKEDPGSDIITVRLQSKDKDSSQEFSLHREAPLSSIFTGFVSQMSAGKHRNVRFLFDGHKVSSHQTPAELDMEDGDIIEVWV